MDDRNQANREDDSRCGGRPVLAAIQLSRVKRDAQTAEFQREGKSDDQSEWEAEAGRWRSFG